MHTRGRGSGARIPEAAFGERALRVRQQSHLPTADELDLVRVSYGRSCPYPSINCRHN